MTDGPPPRFPNAASWLRAIQRAFAEALAREYRPLARRLTTAYQDVLDGLDRQLRDLRALADTDGLKPADFARTGALRRLRDSVEDELDAMRPAIEAAARTAAQDGAQVGVTTGAAALRVAGLVYFARPTPEAVAAMADIVGRPAFQARLARFGPFHAGRVADIALAAESMGVHPRTTARWIANYLKGAPGGVAAPLADTLRMTRTAQVYAGRAGNLETYRANHDVVDGWVWVAALDSRTCPSCWAMHGTVHTLDETLNDHHAGRCSMAPRTATWRSLGFGDGGEVDIRTGEDEFRALDEARQRTILGPARYRAWQDGAFEFSALSSIYQDDVYGPMRRETSLKVLVGTEAARAYVRELRTEQERAGAR